MVVMSRSKGQSVMIGDQIIGDNIVVTIVDIVGDRVRFGVNAPPNMAVVRGDDPGQQSIMLGQDVTVTVIDVRGDKVRVSVVCPREMSVHRKEVYEAILHEFIASALVKKFSDAAESLIDEIRQISDIDPLRRIATSIESAATLDDVRRAKSG